MNEFFNFWILIDAIIDLLVEIDYSLLLSCDDFGVVADFVKRDPTSRAASLAVSRAALIVAVSFFVPNASPQKNSLFCTGYREHKEHFVNDSQQQQQQQSLDTFQKYRFLNTFARTCRKPNEPTEG